MGRVPRVVRIATPILLAFMGAIAIAQPANVSEAEDGHYATPVHRKAIPAISQPVSPPEVASASEVDYREPDPPKAPPKPASTAKPTPSSPKPASAPTPAAPVAPQKPSNEKGVFSITCYTLGGNTSSGHPTGPGVAAADWSILPNGTKISIEGVGEYTVRDRGPRGRTVDIWMSSLDECRKFGRKSRSVTVVE